MTIIANPDCVAGKHGNCDGGWDAGRDEPTACPCACHEGRRASTAPAPSLMPGRRQPMGNRALILTEDARGGDNTGAGIMRDRCAFTSRDMGADWPEAFTYAIVMGWGDGVDDDSDAWVEVAAQFEWDDRLVAFLKDTHERFKRLAESGGGKQ